MNIVGVVADKVGACEVYRTVYPFRAMEAHGHRVVVIKASDFWQSLKEDRFPWRNADIITFQRLILREGEDQNMFNEPARLVREAGVCMVVDYDDDYTNEHRKVHNGTMPDLHSFSGVTVSTPYLGKLMRPYSDNIHVIRNAVNFEILAPFKRVDALKDKIVIGLTGSATHSQDWKAVVEPVLAVAKRHPEVVVFITGYFPPELEGQPGVWGLKDLDPTIEVKDNNFFVPIHEYGAILAQIDILLAPVDPSDRFNWSKSGLKAMEGQASRRDVNGTNAGCAVIATGDLPIYREVIQHGKTGFLVNHEDKASWESYMELLVSDKNLRNRIQIDGYNSCNKLFNVKNRVPERVAAYVDICKRDKVAALSNKSFRSP